MAKKFKDNLPLDGEVYIKDDVRVYLYRGYHVADVDKCAVAVKGSLQNSKWVARSLIAPVKDAK